MYLSPLLGYFKVAINLKPENLVIQTVSSVGAACIIAKAWQW